MVDGWKVTAIVFIILLILETLFLIYAYNLGTEDVEKENECIINVCSEYDAYYYDGLTNICECYIDNELVKQEYLK